MAKTKRSTADKKKSEERAKTAKARKDAERLAAKTKNGETRNQLRKASNKSTTISSTSPPRTSAGAASPRRGDL